MDDVGEVLRPPRRPLHPEQVHEVGHRNLEGASGPDDAPRDDTIGIDRRRDEDVNFAQGVRGIGERHGDEVSLCFQPRALGRISEDSSVRTTMSMS